VTKLPGLPSEPTAVAVVHAAIVLLEQGRVDMALTLLRTVPATIRADLIELAGWASMNAYRRARERAKEVSGS
jgi:hypothetical protein